MLLYRNLLYFIITRDINAWIRGNRGGKNFFRKRVSNIFNYYAKAVTECGGVLAYYYNAM